MMEDAHSTNATGAVERVEADVTAERWKLETWIDFLMWPIPVLAGATAVRLEREARWIHRRTEKFVFLDGRRLRQSIAIELTVPTGFPQTSQEVPVLPIAQPTKRFMRDLVVRDETGRLLSTLTRDENAAVSATMLRQQAKEVLGDNAEPLPEEIVWDFADIAGLRWHDKDYPGDKARSKRCNEALQRFRTARAPTGSEVATPSGEGNPDEKAQFNITRNAEPVRAELWADGVMRSWLLHLAERFVLLVPDVGPEGSRRRLVIEYEPELDPLSDDEADSDNGVAKRLLSAVAKLLRGRSIDHKVNLFTRGPFAASSYHAEVLAPEDLTVVGARLRLLTREAGRGGMVDRWEQIASDRSTPLVHLYANGRRIPREIDDDAPEKEIQQSGAVRVRLRVRAGLVLPVFLTAAVVAGVLTAGLLLRALGHKPESVTAAAILVAFPALYASYLIPQGHPLMRRLFKEFRAMLVALVLLPYAAAATLAVDMNTTVRYVLWIAFDVVALSCLAASTQAVIKALRVTFNARRI